MTLAALAVATVGALGLAGCFARGGLAGEVAAVLEAPVLCAHTAVLEALRADRISIEEEGANQVEGTVRGSFADGRRITFHLRRRDDRTCDLTIQVGSFGDELRSTYLLERVRKQLATAGGTG